MLRVFESQGVPLTTFQKEGGDLNTESEYEVLLMLRECYSKKIVTPADHQDDGGPRTARLAQKKIDQLG